MHHRRIDRPVAAKLIDAIQECAKAIDQAEVIARDIAEPEERDRVRKAIMQAWGILLVEVQHGISADYPDLDPIRKLYK